MAQPRPTVGEPFFHYVIFASPFDDRGEFFVQPYRIDQNGVTPEKTLAWGKTLAAVRKRLPAGLVNLGREEGDEPSVVETWEGPAGPSAAL
jgi:hypothetical protein